MTINELYLEKGALFFPPLPENLPQMVIERGEGSYLFDTEGNRFIDFATGIAIAPVGHCHPQVVAAIQEQAERLISSMNYVLTKPKVDLVEKLVQVLPAGLEKVFLSNSGAEAIEGALKLARLTQRGRPNFIAFNGGFHGRTFGALSVTGSKSSYRKDFFPLLPEVFFVDYPYRLSTEEVIAQIHKLFEYTCPAQSVAALIVESVLGEGGYVVPPIDFLPSLRQLCDQHGILLILDEVQSGFGRTGKWFACQHTTTSPDIITFAKGIASGMPLGGFAASSKLFNQMVSGTHGTTFGGNPISCVSALASIKVIEAEGLTERALYLGDKVRVRLKRRFGEFLDIRGLGLMIGIEPIAFPLNVKNIIRRAETKGLILISCGPHGNVIRLMPALNIPEHILDEGLNILEQILDYEVLVATESKNLRDAQTAIQSQ
ncbi:MAG: aminotransferase class III-fold pyridoxal phosphate-dependent enzyme [Candidatus Caenarcaniphilales bacterium]|nr:aminotransferase class III-fold pyridoxal phosphate-dependent enzyme [Candidatus Caenarcaniphilales bacterium]